MTRQTIRSGPAALAVDVEGREGGIPVLLLHAGVTDRRSWAGLIDELGPGVRTVRYDARGYGDTRTAPDPGWSPVADAVAVLDGLELERAVVVGASMGGATAVDLALAHGERVAGLVLIDPAISGSPRRAHETVVARLGIAMEKAEEQGDLDAVNALEAHLWLDGPGREGRVTGPARDLFLDMNRRALSAADPGETAAQADAWGRTGMIEVPTVVVVGEYDLARFHDNARHLADTVPGARLVQLPGRAHLPHAEGDPASVRAIAGLVHQVARAASASADPTSIP